MHKLFIPCVIFIFLVSCGNEDPENETIIAGKAEIPANPTGTQPTDSISTENNPTLTLGTGTFSDYHTGDIIFQTTMGRFMVPIQQATGSAYTHCGMVVVGKRENRVFVVEAFDSVMRTPVEQWIQRGKEGKFMVMRLKSEHLYLNEATLKNMRSHARGWMGKPYDTQYGWSDDKFYCSELVFKLMHAAGTDLCTPRKLRSYDLGSAAVKAALKQVYGANLPLEELMVSPADLIESSKLEKIFEN